MGDWTPKEGGGKQGAWGGTRGRPKAAAKERKTFKVFLSKSVAVRRGEMRREVAEDTTKERRKGKRNGLNQT